MNINWQSIFAIIEMVVTAIKKVFEINQNK
jgi:hypothetical protein